MRVLVVEDHRRLAEAVAGGLRDEGMAVDVAFDGQDALDHVGLARYDVIVLDRDLPGVHGDQVCAALAGRRCPSRVLMLTAASTIADRVEGLGLGPMTTCPSRSTSPSWWPGSGRWRAAPVPRSPRCCPARTCRWTRPGGLPSGPGGGWP
jgi:CheY-like chemotaxis protein